MNLLVASSLDFVCVILFDVKMVFHKSVSDKYLYKRKVMELQFLYMLMFP